MFVFTPALVNTGSGTLDQFQSVLTDDMFFTETQLTVFNLSSPDFSVPPCGTEKCVTPWSQRAQCVSSCGLLLSLACPLFSPVLTCPQVIPAR